MLRRCSHRSPILIGIGLAVLVLAGPASATIRHYIATGTVADVGDGLGPFPPGTTFTVRFSLDDSVAPTFSFGDFAEYAAITDLDVDMSSGETFDSPTGILTAFGISTHFWDAIIASFEIGATHDFPSLSFGGSVLDFDGVRIAIEDTTASTYTMTPREIALPDLPSWTDQQVFFSWSGGVEESADVGSTLTSLVEAPPVPAVPLPWAVLGALSLAGIGLPVLRSARRLAGA